MACAMEKALHAAIAPARPVTLPLEELLDGSMHVRGRHPRPHFLERQLLALEHRIIELPHRFACAATYYRAGDVSEVARLLGAGKDVQDNRFVGAQRAIAPFVGVAALPAARDN